MHLFKINSSVPTARGLNPIENNDQQTKKFNHYVETSLLEKQTITLDEEYL